MAVWLMRGADNLPAGPAQDINDNDGFHLFDAVGKRNKRFSHVRSVERCFLSVK